MQSAWMRRCQGMTLAAVSQPASLLCHTSIRSFHCHGRLTSTQSHTCISSASYTTFIHRHSTSITSNRPTALTHIRFPHSFSNIRSSISTTSSSSSARNGTFIRFPSSTQRPRHRPPKGTELRPDDDDGRVEYDDSYFPAPIPCAASVRPPLYHRFSFVCLEVASVVAATLIGGGVVRVLMMPLFLGIGMGSSPSVQNVESVTLTTDSMLAFNSVTGASIAVAYFLLTRLTARHVPFMRLPRAATAATWSQVFAQLRSNRRNSSHHHHRTTHHSTIRTILSRLRLQQPKSILTVVIMLTLFATLVTMGIRLVILAQEGEEPMLIELSMAAAHDPSIYLHVGLLAPLIEEIVARGLLFARLTRMTGVLPALIISSFAFGLGHKSQTADKAPTTGLLGAFIAAGYWWSQRLWMPVGLHVAMNASAVQAVAVLSPLHPFDELQQSYESALPLSEPSEDGRPDMVAASLLLRRVMENVFPDSERMKKLRKRLFGVEGFIEMDRTPKSSGSGSVDWNGSGCSLTPESRRLAAACFKMLDRDHKGYLTPMEWASVQMLLPSRHAMMLAAQQVIMTRVDQIAQERGHEGLDEIEANMKKRLTGKEFDISFIPVGAMTLHTGEHRPGNRYNTDALMNEVRASLDGLFDSFPQLRDVPLNWHRLEPKSYINRRANQLPQPAQPMTPAPAPPTPLNIDVTHVHAISSHTQPSVAHSTKRPSSTLSPDLAARSAQLQSDLFATYYCFHFQSRYHVAFPTLDEETNPHITHRRHSSDTQCTLDRFERHLVGQICRQRDQTRNGTMLIRLAQVLTGQHVHPATNMTLVRTQQEDNARWSKTSRPRIDIEAS